MANQNVLFYRAKKEKYDALVYKNPLAIYFVEDIPAIYVGDVLFAVGSEVTSTFAGLVSPEYKAKIDALIESGGNLPYDEIESIWEELTKKVNADDVYTKSEVDNMISHLETKVETSTSDVVEIQEAVNEKADISTVNELQIVIEQKADISTVYTKEEVDNLIIGLDPETHYVFAGGDI